MANMNSTSFDKQKQKRIHKRTITFVLLFVILPWALVAMPGESDGGGGTTGLNVNFRKHGWPFTHLHSTHYDLYGNWVNKTFIRGKPANIDTKPLAIKSHNRFFNASDQQLFEFDTRLTRTSTKYFQYGYWSIPENWPQWSNEHYSEVRWAGLIANLLLLFLAATIVAIPIERKVRNGTLFKYSLFSFAVAITLLGVVMAWGVRAYNGFHSEQQRIQNLARLENEGRVFYVDVEHTDRFPRLISQLLNNGQTMWGDLPFFEKVERVLVNFEIDTEILTEEGLDEVVAATKETDAELEISVACYNDLAEEYLEKFDGVRIVSLQIDFDGSVYEWLEQKIGEDADELEWKEAVEKAKLETSLELKLPHLERLELELTDALPFKDQLEPFVGLPKLRQVSIFDIGEEGARFLLETREHWPNNSYFGITKEVPQELKAKLEEAFPGPDEEGGVF
jgi:hypothetical protein